MRFVFLLPIIGCTNCVQKAKCRRGGTSVCVMDILLSVRHVPVSHTKCLYCMLHSTISSDRSVVSRTYWLLLVGKFSISVPKLGTGIILKMVFLDHTLTWSESKEYRRSDRFSKIAWFPGLGETTVHVATHSDSCRRFNRYLEDGLCDVSEHWLLPGDLCVCVFFLVMPCVSGHTRLLQLVRSLQDDLCDVKGHRLPLGALCVVHLATQDS